MITTIVAIVVAVISFCITRYHDRKFLEATVSKLKLDSEVTKYRAYKDGWADGREYETPEAKVLAEMKAAINK